MTGNLILNTSSPTNALQAASKGYVDNAIKLKHVLNKVTLSGDGKSAQLQFVEEYTDASVIFLYITGTGSGNIYVGTTSVGSSYLSTYIYGKNNCRSYLLVNMGNKVFAPNTSTERGDRGIYYAAVGIDLKSAVYFSLNGVNTATIEAFAIM